MEDQIVRLPMPTEEEFDAILVEMAEMGLVRLSGDQVIMTEAGRAYLDEHLKKPKRRYRPWMFQHIDAPWAIPVYLGAVPDMTRDMTPEEWDFYAVCAQLADMLAEELPQFFPE